MNRPGLKRGFHWNEETQSLGIFANGVQVADYPETVGRTYYVNNITGVSTNDGLSWGSAVAQVSQAITLSEARRLEGAGAPTVTTNDYVRNTIVIQGTGTAYTAISAVPQYCNLVGLGADPSGNGVGIARIDGAGAADAVDTGSSSVRGLDWYNLQFTHTATPGTTYYCFDIAGAMYRSRFEHCGFTNGGAACFHAKGMGSIVIDDCHTKQDQFNALYGALIGSTSGATGNFNNCHIKDSYFHGTTAAFLNYNNSCNDTLIERCTFVGGTNGFVGLESVVVLAHRYFVVGCYAYGTDSTTRNAGGFEVTNDSTTKGAANWGNDAGTLHMWPATQTA